MKKKKKKLSPERMALKMLSKAMELMVFAMAMTIIIHNVYLLGTIGPFEIGFPWDIFGVVTGIMATLFFRKYIDYT